MWTILDVSGHHLKWLARSRDAATGKQLQSPLGEFSDQPAHARFDIASKAARDWFAHLGRGGKAKAITVEVACANYVKHLASEGKARAASARARGQGAGVPDAVGDMRRRQTHLPRTSGRI